MNEEELDHARAALHLCSDCWMPEEYEERNERGGAGFIWTAEAAAVSPSYVDWSGRGQGERVDEEGGSGGQEQRREAQGRRGRRLSSDHPPLRR